MNAHSNTPTGKARSHAWFKVLGAGALALFCVSLSKEAHAETKLACVDGRAKAASMRKQSKLIDAREQLLGCARATCAAAMKRECAASLSELSKLVPSVTFTARDESGKELVDVKVSLEDRVVQDGLTGLTVDVDPGEHTFAFASPGRAPLSVKEVILISEHAHPITVTFGPQVKEVPSPAVAVTPVPSVAAPAPAPADRSPVLSGSTSPALERKGPAVLPVVLLAVAGGLFIGGSVFVGITAKNEVSDLKGQCAPRCTDDQVSGPNSKLIVSDVLLGAGVLSLGGAALVYFLTKPSSSNTQARFPSSPLHFQF
jgi:hypothetical protein